MSEFVLGDSLPNIATKEYDYFFTSPPCYEDLEVFGVTTKEPESYKTKFLDLFVPNINSKNGTVTFSFTGSRKNSGKILPKYHYLTLCFLENGYNVRDVKYTLKSNSYNAYSSQVIHIYTFQKEKMKGKYNLQKNKSYHTYGMDVWGPFGKEIIIDGEVLGQPFEIAERCIQNFTDEGQTVFDPFAGIGTTLAAAKLHNRNYIGYEIRETIWSYGKNKYAL
jgi:hypothetical protein